MAYNYETKAYLAYARGVDFAKASEILDECEAVYVHAPDNSSGHRVQDVEISYNYIGILPATLLYDLQNGKTA